MTDAALTLDSLSKQFGNADRGGRGQPRRARRAS